MITTCNNSNSSFGSAGAQPTRRFSTPFGSGRKISYGDRLFARVVLGGKTVVEFIVNQVNDFTEFLGELRKHTRGFKGLARLYLRNMSRGWSQQRPLMLYGESESRYAVRTVGAAGATAVPSESRMSRALRGEARQLRFPWDL